MQGRARALVAVMLSLMVCSLALAGWVVEVRLRESIERWTAQQLTGVATRAVVTAVAEAARGAAGPLVRYGRDADGNLVSIEYDWTLVNEVLARAASAMERWLRDSSHQEITIPLGEVTGLRTLGARGPALRIRLVTVGAFEVEPFSELTEAGFNQTLHRLGVDVRVRMVVAAPLVGEAVVVRARIPVLENQVVGKVPGFLLLGPRGFGESPGR